jgi:beta-1,4-mannosyl-glycoprotein beta-1,4-N-acetylglucosaminyltransferase
MKRIFDCFLYNDEEDLLYIRLRLLSEVVHEFVIVFSRLTFAGAKRRTTAPMEIVRSLGLDGRVRVIELETLGGNSAVMKERFSRDAFRGGLDGAGPTDLVMVSDVDEIPRPSVLAEVAQSLGPDRHVVLGLDFFNFKFNYQLLHGQEAVWAGPVLCHRGSFTGGQGSRDRRWPLLSDPTCYRDAAGWHFSYLTDSDDVRAKLDNHSHREENVQGRRSISVADLVSKRQGFMDHRHPGSVWAIVGLRSFGCPPLEQLVARYPTFLLDEPPDDPNVISRHVRHAIRNMCLNEREKLLLHARWQELASCLAGRARRRAALILKRAESLVSSARL